MKEPAIRPQVTSIAAHSGREIVLFSNYAVVVLEMQRLDDLQDSSVVLLADDRVENSLMPIAGVTAHSVSVGYGG